MTKRLKVLTVVGNRPEIISLSSTMKILDKYTEHVLVHTGQNYDYEFDEVTVEDLGSKRPDYFLDADTTSEGGIITTGTSPTSILAAVEMNLRAFEAERPAPCPREYEIRNTSRRVLTFIQSTASRHYYSRSGIRSTLPERGLSL